MFDTATCGKGKLAEAYTLSGTVKDYRRVHTYDAIGRPGKTTQTLTDGTYTSTQGYDAWGRVISQTYQRNTDPAKQFDSRYHNGYLARVERGSLVLWKVNAQDAGNRPTSVAPGNGLTQSRVFNPHMAQMTSGAVSTAGNVARLQEGYGYDALSNVLTRQQYWDQGGSQETFTYDALNRLSTSTVQGRTAQTFRYDAAGNLLSKTGVGTGNYTYPAQGATAVRPHAVQSIPGIGGFVYDDNGNLTSGNGRTMSWTSFDMPLTITGGGMSATFVYGPEHQRIRQTRGDGSSVVYAGAQEVEKNASGTTVKTYWPGGIGVEIDRPGATVSELYWRHLDRLGSVIGLTDQQGVLKEKLGYDAWGKRRTLDGASTPNNLDGQVDNRGFTGHEMLDQLDLVHMNGRVYDPLVARFVSGDPLIQDPVDGQNYNRYSYVLNNPTNNTDPTGFAVDPVEEPMTGSHLPGVDTGAKCFGKCNIPMFDRRYNFGSVFRNVKGNSISAASQIVNSGSSEIAPPAEGGDSKISGKKESKSNTEYSAYYKYRLLSRDIEIDIVANVANRVIVIGERLNSSIDLVSDNAASLSKSEIRIFSLLKAITVHDGKRTGVNMDAGIFNIQSSYVLGSSKIWLASVIAHDSYHIEQRRKGYFYNRLTASGMEAEANRFQIQVGVKLGMGKQTVEYLRNDSHTLYNTGSY